LGVCGAAPVSWGTTHKMKEKQTATKPREMSLSNQEEGGGKNKERGERTFFISTPTNYPDPLPEK